MLFSLQLMALLKRGFAPAGESLFVSTKSDAKNDPVSLRKPAKNQKFEAPPKLDGC